MRRKKEKQAEVAPLQNQRLKFHSHCLEGQKKITPPSFYPKDFASAIQGPPLDS